MNLFVCMQLCGPFMHCPQTVNELFSYCFCFLSAFRCHTYYSQRTHTHSHYSLTLTLHNNFIHCARSHYTCSYATNATPKSAHNDGELLSLRRALPKTSNKYKSAADNVTNMSHSDHNCCHLLLLTIVRKHSCALLIALEQRVCVYFDAANRMCVSIVVGACLLACLHAVVKNRCRCLVSSIILYYYYYCCYLPTTLPPTTPLSTRSAQILYVNAEIFLSSVPVVA